jgi:hypothetical protein
MRAGPKPKASGRALLRDAIVNREVTHDADDRLRVHVANAVLRDDRRGVRVAKASKFSRRKTDGAVAAGPLGVGPRAEPLTRTRGSGASSFPRE